MFQNPGDDEIRRLLQSVKTIAMVGLSPRPERDSNHVAQYLIDHGYRVIPVNPTADEILGQKSYAGLDQVPGPVDVVDVFRRPEEVGPIADQAVAMGAKALWLQLTVVNEPAAERARSAGLQVVMDRCIKVEHARLIGA